MDSLRRLLGEGVIGEYAGPRAFFKTVAGPGPYDAYPGAGENPSVYYARRLKNVTFPRAIGNQSLEYDTTDHYDFVFNLEPLKYIEEGAIVLCFRENGQWYTIDKVLEERPCCGNRLFRGPGSVSSLTLSLESRQTWAVVGPATPCATGYIPYGNNPTGNDPTRILGACDLSLTYERPISSEFLTGLRNQYYQATPPVPYRDINNTCRFPNDYEQYPLFFDPAEGWYVSEPVGLYQVPGDSVWDGSLYNITGRYFLARMYRWIIPPGTCESADIVKQFAHCATGFVFSSDVEEWPEGGGPYGVRELAFNRIKNGEWISGQKNEALFHSERSEPTRGWELLPAGVATRGIVFSPGLLAGVNLGGLGLLNTTSCSPFFSQQSGPSLSESGCGIRGSSGGVTPSTVGLYASPFRGLSMTSGLGGRGDLPDVDDTPPSDISALTSSRIVSEIFYMHFTVSE